MVAAVVASKILLLQTKSEWLTAVFAFLKSLHSVWFDPVQPCEDE